MTRSLEYSGTEVGSGSRNSEAGLSLRGELATGSASENCQQFDHGEPVPTRPLPGSNLVGPNPICSQFRPRVNGDASIVRFDETDTFLHTLDRGRSHVNGVLRNAAQEWVQIFALDCPIDVLWQSTRVLQK